jgi:uncharacterized SAM-binding protein YcdF (DUF218 family)
LIIWQFQGQDCHQDGLLQNEVEMNSTKIQSAPAPPYAPTARIPFRSKKLMLLAGLVAIILFFARYAGQILVTDHPEKADVIVVLAGDSQDARYRRGMELLRAGYGRRLFLDASSDSSYFGHTPAQYAESFIRQDAPELAAQVSVCPFEEDSTLTETRFVAKCLEPLHPARVLLVTSDWHTSRACSIFVHQLAQYQWSIAAATDDRLFNTHWWRHREWAKTTFQEWLKVIWWNAVDRWR